MRKFLRLGAVLGAAAVLAFPALGLSFTASSGTRAAEVQFNDLGGGRVQIILTNTSLDDVLVPVDVLTAVFFSISGVTLSPVSATLTDYGMPGGSVVLFGFPDGSGNVGGEWAYGSGLAGAPLGATSGISSTGFGLFGAPNLGGPDLAPPPSLDGLNYGLVSAGDDPGTGNTPVKGDKPLIQNSITFVLSYSGTIGSITDISFQYGTDLTEPNEPGQPIPEPATVTLLGLGLAGLAVSRIRRTMHPVR